MLRNFIAVAICLSASSVFGRTWTDAATGETYDADIVSIAMGVVKLARADGAVIKVPIDGMVDGDAAYVRKYISDSAYRHPPKPALSHPIKPETPKLAAPAQTPASELVPPKAEPPAFNPIGNPSGPPPASNPADSPLAGALRGLFPAPKPHQEPAKPAVPSADPAPVPSTPPSPPRASPPAQRLPPRPSSHRMDLKLPSAKYLRSKLTPEAFDQRLARMRRAYGYKYDTWNAMPMIWVGGFIGHVFWYSTADWAPERQATWLYNYQDVLEPELLAERLTTSDVWGAYQKLKQSNAVPNPYFVDPEFSENPDLMYREEYVDAVYREPDFEDQWTVPYSTMLIGCVGAVILLIAWSKHEGYF